MTDLNATKVLVSGGSGLIGTALVRGLTADRIAVIRLVRRKASGEQEVEWHPEAEEPMAEGSSLEGLSAVIHLSGVSLSGHCWTAAYKREIVDSRVLSTRALVGLLKKLERPPKSFLCASAVGIYGNRGDETLTEESSRGEGFLAETCRAWEAEAQTAEGAGMRVVKLRTGLVLAHGGGALEKLLPLFRAGMGGRLGSGKQWLSWITLSDQVRALRHIMATDSLAGPVNLVAPMPVTNGEFVRAVGRALRRPAVVPAPAFLLRAVLGEMADAALLASTRAVPQRLLESGFQFEFPEINGAMQSVI
jgi:uncharacterized protein